MAINPNFLPQHTSNSRRAWHGMWAFDMARHIPGNAKAYAAPCQGTGLGMPGHIICFGMAMHMPGHAKACALECLGIFFGLARHVPWHVQAYAFSFLGMPVPMRFGTPRLMPTCPAHALACLGICIGMPGHAKHMLWHAKALTWTFQGICLTHWQAEA